MLGGLIFSALERDGEAAHRASLTSFLQRMRDALPAADFEELVSHIDQRLARAIADNRTAPHDWDFVGACFFCFAAATTIGYGDYTPTTAGGKLFLVLYALVAIPLCLHTLAEVSDRTLDFLASRFSRLRMFDKRVVDAFHMFDSDRSGKLDRSEVRRAMRTLGYRLDDSEHGRELAAKFDEGFTASDPDGDGALDVDEFRVFVLTVAPDASARVEAMLSKGYTVLLAAGLFTLFVAFSTLVFAALYAETNGAWSHLDAFYFTIVTFTTIGFGDFSPDPHPAWFSVLFIVITFFGLGITATVVRSAADPGFNLAATLRGLAPTRYELLAARCAPLTDRLGWLLGRRSRAQAPIILQHRVATHDSAPGSPAVHSDEGSTSALARVDEEEVGRAAEERAAPGGDDGFSPLFLGSSAAAGVELGTAGAR